MLGGKRRHDFATLTRIVVLGDRPADGVFVARRPGATGLLRRNAMEKRLVDLFVGHRRKRFCVLVSPFVPQRDQNRDFRAEFRACSRLQILPSRIIYLCFSKSESNHYLFIRIIICLFALELELERTSIRTCEFMIFFITLCIFINWGCATIYAQREGDRTFNVRY